MAYSESHWLKVHFWAWDSGLSVSTLHSNGVCSAPSLPSYLLSEPHSYGVRKSWGLGSWAPMGRHLRSDSGEDWWLARWITSFGRGSWVRAKTRTLFLWDSRCWAVPMPSDRSGCCSLRG